MALVLTTSALALSEGSPSWSPIIYLTVLTQISSSSLVGSVTLTEPSVSSPIIIPGVIISRERPGSYSLQEIPFSSFSVPGLHSQVFSTVLAPLQRIHSLSFLQVAHFSGQLIHLLASFLN